ncbi:MAG: hypothetical protein HY567_03760 [Candidatus Kerfeldbacteria bacterium]|nr:hypothetical protein [Candidatus Kerfeldbacteria bacterium]
MRIFKIVILVTIVVVVAFAAVAWFRWRGTPSTTNRTPIVTAGVGNTNTVQTPPITSGDIPLDVSVSYRDVTFGLDSALRTETFRRKKADDGQEFVVIFLKPFSSNPPADIATWVSADIQLTASGVNQRPVEVGLPKLANQAGGFLSFQVPVGTKGMTLAFGSGASATTVKLSF